MYFWNDGFMVISLHMKFCNKKAPHSGKAVLRDDKNRGTTQIQIYVAIYPLQTSNKVLTANAVLRHALNITRATRG